MSEVLTVKEPIEEDTNPTFFARVVNAYGVALIRSDVEANGVVLRVFDLSADDPNTVILTQSSLDPSTVYGGHALMENTLQTQGWSKDSIGWNLTYTPDLTALYSTGMYGSRVLRFEFELSLAIGGKAWACFECVVRSMKSS